MQFVQVNRLELDELWSYVAKKQGKVKPTDPADIGDQYVFSIDANLKAIISYRVGKRDAENANAFLADHPGNGDRDNRSYLDDRRADRRSSR